MKETKFFHYLNQSLKLFGYCFRCHHCWSAIIWASRNKHSSSDS